MDSENIYNVDSTSFAPSVEMQCLSWHRNGIASTLIFACYVAEHKNKFWYWK